MADLYNCPSSGKGNERNNLERCFEKWEKARILTIEQIRKLAEQIQESETDYRKGQVATSGAGIVSGGLAIAGILIAPFTAGLSLGLTTGSLAVGATSGVVGLAHSAIYCSQVRSSCQEAKMRMETDNELTKKLMKDIKINRMDDCGFNLENIRLVESVLDALPCNVSNIATMANNFHGAAETTKKVIETSIKKIGHDGNVRKLVKFTRIAGKKAVVKGTTSTKFVQIASKVALPIAIFGTVMDVWSLVDNADKLNSGELSAQARELMKVADDLEDEIVVYKEKIRELLSESKDLKLINQRCYA